MEGVLSINITVVPNPIKKNMGSHISRPQAEYPNKLNTAASRPTLSNNFATDFLSVLSQFELMLMLIRDRGIPQTDLTGNRQRLCSVILK